MAWYILGFALIAMVLLFIALRVPIFLSLGVSSLIMLFFTQGISSLAAANRIVFGTITDFSLVSLPMFIIMGELIAKTNFAEDMFDVISKWARFIPGALAITSAWVCLVFGAVIGTAAGVAAVVGMAAIPVMIKNNYSSKIATGVMAGASDMGILIPPSIPFIIYGVVTGTSIGKMFLAGIIPAFMMCSLYSIYIIVRVIRHPEEAPKPPPISWNERLRAIANLNLWVCIAIIGLCIGSIWGGVLTPTEAGGGGAVAVLLGGIITRQLGLAKIQKALAAAANFSVRIMVIVITAKIFSFTLVTMDVPSGLIEAVTARDMPPFLFFMIMGMVLVLLGMFIDITPIILLTMPVFFPPLIAFGYDPIWLGVMIVLFMCMAVVTPPLGLSCYVVSMVSKYKAEHVFQSAIPFLIINILAVVIVYLFPEIATWLPSKI